VCEQSRNQNSGGTNRRIDTRVLTQHLGMDLGLIGRGRGNSYAHSAVQYSMVGNGLGVQVEAVPKQPIQMVSGSARLAEIRNVILWSRRNDQSNVEPVMELHGPLPRHLHKELIG
jgi:hypothetical protein